MFEGSKSRELGDGEASSAVMGETVGLKLNGDELSIEFGETSTCGLAVELW